MLRLIMAAVALSVSSGAAAEGAPACIKDNKNASIIADLQLASFVCPKWNVMPRAEYAYMLVQMSVIAVDDILKTPENTPGLINFREPCAAELSKIESGSAKMAKASGMDEFCLRVSGWLMVPNLRFALERNGTIPTK